MLMSDRDILPRRLLIPLPFDLQGGMAMYSDGQHMVFHGDFGSGRAMYNAMVDINSDAVRSSRPAMSSDDANSARSDTRDI